MKYRIKDVTNRRNINLNNHSQNIISAVQTVFLNSSVNVYSDYFEILDLPINISDSSLRKMGQEIAHRDKYLHSIAKKYNYTRSNGNQAKSVQIFEKF